MQRTQNYNLCQWEAEDRIMRSDFNADNQKIDTALKAANDAIPRIATGTYRGSGSYGTANARSIECGFAPKFVVVLRGDNNPSFSGLMIRPCSIGLGRIDNNAVLNASWSDTGVSWYGSSVETQLNVNNVPYYWWAIG